MFIFVYQSYDIKNHMFGDPCLINIDHVVSIHCPNLVDDWSDHVDDDSFGFSLDDICAFLHHSLLCLHTSDGKIYFHFGSFDWKFDI